MTHKTPALPVTKADRDLYKFILDAPFATCVQINNMRDDTPELQAIAKHRLEASHHAELVEALAKLANENSSFVVGPSARRFARAVLAKIGGYA